jgi:hypothetical protein
LTPDCDKPLDADFNFIESAHTTRRTNRKDSSMSNFTKGTKVNVTVDGDAYIGEVVRAIAKGKKYRVRFDDGSESNHPAENVELRKRGRKSIEESMTPDEIQGEINDLLAELQSTDDQDRKKIVRRALRRRGHMGGLGKGKNKGKK